MILNLLVEDPGARSGWLALEDPDSGLRLGANTFAQSAATVRRVDASNPYVPGTFTVRAVPDNVTTSVELQVFDSSTLSRESKVSHLVSLFTRSSYRLRQVVDEPGVAIEMVAQAADWQANTQREFLHAGLTVLVFNFSVLPGREKVVHRVETLGSSYGYSLTEAARTAQPSAADVLDAVKVQAAEAVDFADFQRRVADL